MNSGSDILHTSSSDISGSIPKRSSTMIPFPVPVEDEMQAASVADSLILSSVQQADAPVLCAGEKTKSLSSERWLARLGLAAPARELS